MEHPAEEILLRFARGMASRPENRLVVRHLLARCPTCAIKLNKAMNEEPPSSPAGYDQALARLTHQLANENEEPEEADRRPGTVTTAKAARRRWRFG